MVQFTEYRIPTTVLARSHSHQAGPRAANKVLTRSGPHRARNGCPRSISDTEGESTGVVETATMSPDQQACFPPLVQPGAAINAIDGLSPKTRARDADLPAAAGELAVFWFVSPIGKRNTNTAFCLKVLMN